jgi:predicted RNA-binding Zn-ribbon protein involved in translation (DUF1610 family)
MPSITPPRTATSLWCPGCGRPLSRRGSTVTRRGGDVDRCDLCECDTCGRFEVREARRPSKPLVDRRRAS